MGTFTRVKIIWIALLALLATLAQAEADSTAFPKLVVIRVNNTLLVQDSAGSSIISVTQLRTFLGTDSFVVILPRQMEAQLVQLSRMSKDIIRADTTMKSLRFALMQANHRHNNDLAIIGARDTEIVNLRHELVLADQQAQNYKDNMKQIRRKWLKITMMTGGGALLVGATTGILISLD